MFDMSNISDKLMNNFFRPVQNAMWDMQTGKLGILVDGGIATLKGSGEDAQIEINMMEQFGVAVPAFAQSTPVASLKEGDLIYVNNTPKGWIVEAKKTENDGAEPTYRFKVISAHGNITSWNPPKLTMLGFDSGTLVLRSLMNMLPGGNAGLGNMQQMMMFMGMAGGDINQIMPMLLMSQMSGSTGTDSSNNMNMNMLMMPMMMAAMSGTKVQKGGSPFSVLPSRQKTHFDRDN